VRQIIALCVLFLSCMQAYAETPTDSFKIESPVAADQGALPELYTCDGKNISPKISWSGKPAHTKTMALIVSDPDAPDGTFYHWILYNLPPHTQGLDEDFIQLPGGTQSGRNSFGNTSYNGPCPPAGSSHHYIFTLYALDKKLNLPIGIEAPALLEAMRNHILDKTTFVAVYTRWK
jgi:Raf kinase inhibitor-like YbhB/YbcL family protein